MIEITMPRAKWYAAYRHATEEARDMAWDADWKGTGLRQDCLVLSRAAKAVLDANPVGGEPYDNEEEIAAEVSETVVIILETNGFIRPHPDL